MKPRPITAPIWAISFTVCRRSRRAINESCNVLGIASGGSGPEHIRIAALLQQAGLHHHLGQRFDEQGHAIGAIDDLLDDFFRQRFALRNTQANGAHLRGIKPLQRDVLHARVVEPRRNEAQPAGEEHQDAMVFKHLDHLVQDVERQHARLARQRDGE